MPQLPSGLTLALFNGSLIEHEGNWFACPKGHFWFLKAAPEMGPPPYDPHTVIMQIPEHAKVPSSRAQAKQFIRVLEMLENGHYGWRGEWLSDFPRYLTLNELDKIAWERWLNTPSTLAFLDETILTCSQLAELSQNAVGYVVTTASTEPDGEGWMAVTWDPRRRR
jgi:hypothetical protein